jgi:hypothetical protein
MTEAFLNITVYKLKNNVDDKIYIGSTVKHLPYRLAEHRCDSRRYNTPLYKYMREVGEDNWDIEEIINVDVNDKKEQREYERNILNEYINTGKCLNTYSPITTKEERREKNKHYKIIKKLKSCLI